jgi:hypothetical protein
MSLQIKIVSIAITALLSGAVGAQSPATQNQHSGHSEDVANSDSSHSHHDHADSEHHHEAHPSEPGGAASDSTAMLTRTDAIEAALSEGGEPIVADVLGVVCDFCALAMNKIFGKRGEVAAMYVDLDTKALSLVLTPGASLSDEAIADLAMQAGYRVADVRRGREVLGNPS